MKKNIAHAVLLTGIILLLLSCNEKKDGAAAPLIDKELVKKEIQAREDAFAEVYNNGILKDIGYYADDAVSFFPNRPPLIGKQAIRAFFISSIVSKTDKISFNTRDVFVSGDQVVEIGFYKVVDSTNTAINTGNYMSLFEKRDGKYVCVRDMSVSDMPVK